MFLEATVDAHSDFDLVLVVSHVALKRVCGDKSLHNQKHAFFFDKLAINIGVSPSIKVFPISNAKVPILNIEFKQKLWIDLAICVVQEIEANPFNLNPFDEQSEQSLRSVLVSIKIKEYVKQINQTE